MARAGRTRSGSAAACAVDSASPGPTKRVDIWIGLLLAFATLAAYWQVRTHDFINFDDLYYVNNPHVLQGLTLDGFFWALRPTHSPNFWFPLTWLSHMLDRQLFGDRS